MADDIERLWTMASQSMQAGRPGDAICYLAEVVASQPADRVTRMSLAMGLGQAGNAAGAMKVIRALADRLAREGYLLPAIVCIRQGLEAAREDPQLIDTLKSLHVSGMRAKPTGMAIPPPLRPRGAATPATTAAALLALPMQDRLTQIAELGTKLPPPGVTSTPTPMPLFGELDADAFVETVKRLRYRRVPSGTRVLEEGKPGDTLLIIVSGQVAISKNGAELARLGAGAVLGEMALITGAPRSATAIAVEAVEYFELARSDLAQLAKVQPKVAEELVLYCRRRLLSNLMRTSPLFARFDEPTRVNLLSRFQTISFAADETIIAQGEPASGLYLIASGEVEVRIANDAGDSVVVATLGAGEVFGEISLLKNQPTTAFVMAKNTVGALVLPTQEFQRVLAEHPAVGQYLMGLTADRLKASAAALDQSDVMNADDLIVL